MEGYSASVSKTLFIVCLRDRAPYLKIHTVPRCIICAESRSHGSIFLFSSLIIHMGVLGITWMKPITVSSFQSLQKCELVRSSLNLMIIQISRQARLGFDVNYFSLFFYTSKRSHTQFRLSIIIWSKARSLILFSLQTYVLSNLQLSFVVSDRISSSDISAAGMETFEIVEGILSKPLSPYIIRVYMCCEATFESAA